MISDVDTQMMLASRRMVMLEQLEDKSDEYKKGFYAGIALESDFDNAMLSPLLQRLDKAIDSLLGALSRQS